MNINLFFYKMRFNQAVLCLLSFPPYCFQAIFGLSLRVRQLSDIVLAIVLIVASVLPYGDISFLDHVVSTPSGEPH